MATLRPTGTTNTSVERRRVFRAGAMQFDEARLALSVDGQPRALEAKPTALLHALLVRAGAAASKRELIEAVWGNADYISEASLTTAMSKLRAALGDKGRDIIEAIHGSGYRIAVPVELTTAREAPRLAFTFVAGEAVPGRPQWRLEKALAAGPLNDVWLARHEKTGEARVFKFADSAERLETLRREAALSRVLHATLGDRADLVRITEWNFDQPPYYIESAYGGDDLLAWSAARGGLAKIALATRLALIAGAARTLAAAHAAGVLHNDIKPANILVASGPDGPAARLVDFGAGGLNDAARLHALSISLPNLQHAAGERGTGTLRYMAPEVLAGGVATTGADIYALGILLYHLVAGDLSKPLAVGWEDDIADELLRDDIAAAAAGDPARRLASAAELANRLETLPARRAARQAEAEATAAAALLAHAVERERARRPWVAAAALSMVAGLALSAWFGVRAVQARDEARRRADIAQAVNNFLTQDLLGRGNPAQSGKADETLMEAAQAAEAGIGRRLASEPLVAGSIYLSLARAFESRSAYDAARTAYGNAIGAFGRAGGPGAAELIITKLHQANMEVLSGQPGSMQRANDMLAQVRPQLGRLGARRAEAAVWLAAAGAMMQMLGGDVRAAQEGFASAAAGADQMPDLFDEDSRLMLHQRLAFTYMRQGKWAEAAPMINTLLQQRLALSGPRHPSTLQLQMNQAQIRIGQGNAQAAIAGLNAALPVFVEVFGPGHLLTMELRSVRAHAYMMLGRYDDAVADQMAIYDTAVAQHGSHSFMALGTLADAAESRCRAGDTKAGLAAAQQAYNGGRAAFGDAATLTQLLAFDLAFCRIKAGLPAQVLPLLAGLDRHAMADLAMDQSMGAKIDVLRAAVAQAAGDSAAAKTLLAQAAPAFSADGADLYMRSWVAALQGAR